MDRLPAGGDLLTTSAIPVDEAYPDVYVMNSSRLPVYSVRASLWVSFQERPVVWQARAALPPCRPAAVAHRRCYRP